MSPLTISSSRIIARSGVRHFSPVNAAVGLAAAAGVKKAATTVVEKAATTAANKALDTAAKAVSSKLHEVTHTKSSKGDNNNNDKKEKSNKNKDDDDNSGNSSSKSAESIVDRVVETATESLSQAISSGKQAVNKFSTPATASSLWSTLFDARRPASAMYSPMFIAVPQRSLSMSAVAYKNKDYSKLDAYNQDVASEAQSAINKGKQVAREVADEASEMAGDAASKAKKFAAAGGVGYKVGQMAQSAKDTLQGGESTLLDAARSMAGNIAERGQSIIDEAKSMAQNATNSVAETVEESKNAIRDTVEQGQSAIHDATEAAKTTAAGLMGQGKGYANAKADEAQRTAENLSSQAKKTAGKVAHDAKEVVDEAANRLRR
ncbi:hypothetical protein RI367_004220 [Sorochytrium milnesiophthora]